MADDKDQLASLVLLSPQSGKPMRICSKLKANPDGTFSFDVESADRAERYRITMRVEEVLRPSGNGSKP